MELAHVVIPAAGVDLHADVGRPDHAHGIVLFAHGSGSSRFSPRNQSVATVLQEAGHATVLADLLTPEEEAADQLSGEFRFDIGLLAGRLVGIVDWLTSQPDTGQLRAGQLPVGQLPIGLFGASTGAAAALIAAAERPDTVRAVVSRGGRPDLADGALTGVRAPTLFIVGGADRQVLALNQEAARYLLAPYQLHLVDGATHLFEEPGALAEVAEQAVAWFNRHLTASTT